MYGPVRDPTKPDPRGSQYDDPRLVRAKPGAPTGGGLVYGTEGHDALASRELVPWAAQNANAFRYGNFSPDANRDINVLRDQQHQLSVQGAPQVGPVQNTQAQIDQGRVAMSTTGLNDASTVAGRQGKFLDTLQTAAEGGAPSVAQQQLATGQASAARDAMSIANSARGGAGNSVAAIRAALRSNAASDQATNAQTATLRASEMAQARGDYGAAMGQKRAQDLGQSSTAYGQGLQTGQFGAQQNQFDSSMRQKIAEDNANLEAQQRGLNLQGQLGYGGQRMQIGAMDMGERDQTAALLNSRDLSERGLAAQQSQADTANTWKTVGTVAATVAPFVLAAASDVRGKKNIEPADAAAASPDPTTSAIARGLAAGGAMAGDTETPDWARMPADSGKTKASREMARVQDNPQRAKDPTLATAPAALPPGSPGSDPAQASLVDPWKAEMAARQGQPPPAAFTDPAAADLWTQQHPLTGAPMYASTWGADNALNMPGVVDRSGPRPRPMAPPQQFGSPRYLVSDTTEKKNQVRADATGDLHDRLAALEARMSGGSETTQRPLEKQMAAEEAASLGPWRSALLEQDWKTPHPPVGPTPFGIVDPYAGTVDNGLVDPWKRESAATQQPAPTMGQQPAMYRSVAPLPPSDLDAAYAKQGADVAPRYALSDTEAKKNAIRAEGFRDGAAQGVVAGGTGGADLRPAVAYSYEYKDPHAPGAAPGRQIGPMAQDLEKTPAGASAVKTGPDGKKMVDASRLSLVNAAATGEAQRRLDALEARMRGDQQSAPVDTSSWNGGKGLPREAAPVVVDPRTGRPSWQTDKGLLPLRPDEMPRSMWQYPTAAQGGHP